MHPRCPRLLVGVLVALAPALLLSGVFGAQPVAAVAGQKVVNAASPHPCLDMTNGSKSAGTIAQIWTCNGLPQQYWSFPVTTEGGAFLIKNENSGLCLSILHNSTALGAAVIQWSCVTSGADKFEDWYRLGSGPYDFGNFGDGLVMHPSGCGTRNGSGIFMNVPDQCTADLWSVQ
jgi:Ricin-type beta-trefoil lectin domain-like